MPRAGDRLDRDALARNFGPVPLPLGADEALVEASRCLFCFDAPCTRACPTGIDVPKFIRQVLHRNDAGAARTILDANVFGGSCARACPTEVLCEGACVAHTLMKAPIPIGRLQRHACDAAGDRVLRAVEPGPPTGRRVAVVGSGPAGLSCAHELRRFGHEVVVFEARGVPGGLDALGIAPYKVPAAFALGEIEAIRAIGGIDLRLNHRIEAGELPRLLADFDAVFLGVGLGRTAPLGIDGEDLPGVWEALDFIFQAHQQPFEDCEVGRRVLVIGGGNTAIDVATAATRLGAGSVTIAYRRGPDAMPAFAYEVGLARGDGVRFEFHAAPIRVVARDGIAAGVEFTRVEPGPGGRVDAVRPIAGSEFTVEADMVVKALGQVALVPFLDALPDLTHDRGRVAIDPGTRQTTVPGLFAGGDCLRNGGEVVDAVQDGKLAARGIHAFLEQSPRATDGTRMGHGSENINLV